ncbi:helix-turn-helix domain-containing protein [Thalassoglobus sp. JC818]|uniref:helix-turn-helix domain-containing protein n=1 Tax=Thalassoglobus sp. JC818 TaxID=3232136 RepID=UPI003458A453
MSETTPYFGPQFSSAQAAKKIGVSLRTFRKILAAGEIECFNVGRGNERPRYKFSQAQIDAYLQQRAIKRVERIKVKGKKAQRDKAKFLASLKKPRQKLDINNLAGATISTGWKFKEGSGPEGRIDSS